MAYTYTPSNITAKQKMNLSVWSMQFTSSINNIIEIFISSFLVSFIMQTNSNEPISSTLISVALYYISLYGVMLIVYTLLSYLVDRTNRVVFYRFSIILKGCFIVVIIFLGKDLARLSALAGAFIGLAEAFYYSSYNVLKGEIIPRAHADKFIVLNTVFKRIVNIIFPILLGFLIDISTYTTVAFYVLIIVAIQFVFACLIKSKRPDNSAFEFFKYLKALRSKTDDIKRIRRFYPIVIGYACTTLISSLITLLTIYTFKTNFSLGLFTALFAFLNISFILLFKRFTKEGYRKTIYIILSVLPVIISIVVAIKISKWTYVVYNLIMTVSQCLLSYALDVQRTIILKKTNHYEYIAEHQAVTEAVFQITRIVTFSLMLVLGITLDLIGLKILIAVISICFPIMGISLIRIENVEKNYSIETRVVCVEATVEEGENALVTSNTKEDNNINEEKQNSENNQ